MQNQGYYQHAVAGQHQGQPAAIAAQTTSYYAQFAPVTMAQLIQQQQNLAGGGAAAAAGTVNRSHMTGFGASSQSNVMPTLDQSSTNITAMASQDGAGGNMMAHCVTRPPPPIPLGNMQQQQQYSGHAASQQQQRQTHGLAGAVVDSGGGGAVQNVNAVGDLGSLLCQLAGYTKQVDPTNNAVASYGNAAQTAVAPSVASMMSMQVGTAPTQPAATNNSSATDEEVLAASEKFRQVLVSMGVDGSSIQNMQLSLVQALRNKPSGAVSKSTNAKVFPAEAARGPGSVHIVGEVEAKMDTPEQAKEIEKERKAKLDETKTAYDKLVAQCKKLKTDLDKTKDKSDKIRKTMHGSKAKTSPLLETNLQLQHTLKTQLNLQQELKSRLKSLKDFREKQLKEAQDRVKQFKKEKESEKEHGSKKTGSKSHGTRHDRKRSKRGRNRSKDRSESTEAKVPRVTVIKYVDGGGHKCDTCNVTCDNVFDYCTHLHTGLHRSTIKAAYRPWCSESHAATQPTGDNIRIKSQPLQGVEHLMPCLAYYCTLCNTFCGDLICAEEHLKTEAHHDALKASRLAAPARSPAEKKPSHGQNDRQEMFVEDINLVVKNSHSQVPMGPPLPGSVLAACPRPPSFVAETLSANDHHRLVHESGRQLKVQLQWNPSEGYDQHSDATRTQQHRMMRSDELPDNGHRPSVTDRLGAPTGDYDERRRQYSGERYAARDHPGYDNRQHSPPASKRRNQNPATPPPSSGSRFTTGQTSSAAEPALPTLSRTERLLEPVDQRRLLDCMHRRNQGVASATDRNMMYRLQRKAEYLARNEGRRNK